LRQCLTDPELNIILHDDIGHDVDRLLLENWTIYDMPTSYDTEPMYKMPITRKKKRNDKTARRPAKTTKRRTIDRARGRRSASCG
jgi:hypothetical protein